MHSLELEFALANGTGQLVGMQRALVFGRLGAEVARRQRQRGIDHGLVILVAQHVHHERHTTLREILAQARRQHIGALLVVAAVDNHRGIVAHHFEAALPHRGLETRLNGLIGNLEPTSAQHARNFDGHHGIIRLVGTRKLQAHIGEAVVGKHLVQTFRMRMNATEARHTHRCAHLASTLHDNGLGFGLLFVAHHGNAGLDDAGFFVRDFGDGVAKHVRVVERDRGNGAHLGHDDIRGVEPAAQAHLEHHRRAADLRKVQQRRRRDKLERRGLLVHPLGRFAHLERHSEQIFIGNIFAIHLNALIEAQHIRRSKQTNLVARRLQNARGERARRPLAVRACHMHDAQAILRAAQALEQLFRTMQPQANVAPRALLQVHFRVEFFSHASSLDNGSLTAALYSSDFLY